MQYLNHLIFGFLMAFIGLLPPGMLNMTAMKTAISVNKNAGYKFSLGAALVVFPQAFIALYFANYFSNHPEVIDGLSYFGVVVLFLLSVLFFYQARRKQTKESKVRKGNYFLIGVLMSAVNMLAIPYYLVYSTLFESKGWLILERNFILIFVFGAFLGAFVLFSIFVKLSDFLITRVRFVARNINYILSVLFFVLAISTWVNIVSK